MGAVLKKILISLLPEKKFWKTAGGILLGIVIIIAMPVAALTAIVNGNIELDYDRLEEIAVERMTAEQTERLQAIEDTAKSIDDALEAKGCSVRQKQAAQIVYIMSLSSNTGAEFVNTFTSCFAAGQNDIQIVESVNAMFGIAINPDDLTALLPAFSSDIVAVASQEIGNVGGEKYWRWYGFESRTAWCACFVSWCADQCGLIEAGLLPKFASCSDGIAWLRAHDQWRGSGRDPQPGMLIFFDWGLNGSPDHVGIVESVDGDRVFTIEGNTTDSCRRRSYPLRSPVIIGYGTY